MADDIEAKVIEIVAKQMDKDAGEITRETSFVNTPELVKELEDQFELSIPDEEAEKIETVGQVIDYIADHGIEGKVIKIVSEQMGKDASEIARETSFVNDLNADSLDTVELVMEFEDQFELSIPDEDAEKIQTVGQAIDYITEHSAQT